MYLVQSFTERITVLKKFLKWISGIVIALCVLALCVFTTVDRTPYKEMPYYTSMMQGIDSFHVSAEEKKGNPLKAAWSSVALTPASFPHPLAGYGLRKPAIAVKDTTYVRTFVFDNGKTRVAYICLDLLIFPPDLKDKVREELEKKYALHVFLTATHTHSAPGGWEPKVAGRVLAGSYSEEYVALLFNAIEKSIAQALPNLQPVEQAYIHISAPEAVHNRLKGPTGPEDPFIRGLKFRNIRGEEACLFTFAAHANCLESDIDYISGDYPARISKILEKKGWASFVSYAAGAVGSHGPAFAELNNGEQEADSMAIVLSDKLMHATVTYAAASNLYYHRFPLYLREPHLRLEKNIRIRPWVFRALIGTDQPDIQLLQVGETVILGMPCDYSGELMPPLEKLCEKNHMNFMLSGFNGGYIGYITDDACYDWPRGETMDMNWHGPYNAAYLTEVNTAILKKVVHSR
jgi:neutral ceramidase